MNPIIKRLQGQCSQTHEVIDSSTMEWRFTSEVKSLGSDFYSKIYPQHLALNLEYSVLRQQLNNNLAHQDKVSKAQITDELVAALMLAEILEHLFRYYLDNPREVERLQSEQIKYREMLRSEGLVFPLSKDVLKIKSQAVTIHDGTGAKNWDRLFKSRPRASHTNFMGRTVIPSVIDNATSEWKFTSEIKTLGEDFHSRIRSQHQLWNLEYSVLRQKLLNELAYQDKVSKEQITDDLVAALMLAEVLEHHCVDNPYEAWHLRADQRKYRERLREEGLNFPLSKDKNVKSRSLRIREEIGDKNWYRLFTSRSIRALTVIELFTSHTGSYTNFIMGLNVVSSHVLPYAAFIIFYPRLLTNLGLLLKHTIPGNWMSDEEKSLAWTTRFVAQFKRRWFEIGNDAAWATVGTINCFVLVGALAPFAIYLSISFFTYDVFLAAFRAYAEFSQIKSLRADYDLMLNKPDIDPMFKKEIQAYKVQLTKRLHFEALRLGINVASMASIVLAACCALPIFLACPAIPLAGALWLVTISLITFIVNRTMDYYRPRTDVEPDMLVSNDDKPPEKTPTPIPRIGSYGFFSSVMAECRAPAPLNRSQTVMFQFGTGS